MADPSLATLDDFLDRFPAEGVTVDESRATAALQDASAVVRVEADEDWLDTDGDLETVPDVIVAVTCSSAIRAYLWSPGKTSEQIGGWSASYSSREDALALTPAEKRLIRRSAGATGLDAIVLESPYTSEDTTYVDVYGTTERVPLYDGDVGY